MSRVLQILEQGGRLRRVQRYLFAGSGLIAPDLSASADEDE
jgi:hypothetical protein